MDRLTVARALDFLLSDQVDQIDAEVAEHNRPGLTAQDLCLTCVTRTMGALV